MNKNKISFSKGFYIIIITLLTLTFTTKALASLTFTTNTISGNGIINLNPTGQPVTVNGDLTTTGNIIFGSDDSTFTGGEASVGGQSTPAQTFIGTHAAGSGHNGPGTGIGLGIEISGGPSNTYSPWGIEVAASGDSPIGIRSMGIASKPSGSAISIEAFMQADVNVTGVDLTGVYVPSPFLDSGSTVTNTYGLLIGDQTAATNNYAIKTGLGLNSFGDDVVIGGSSGIPSIISNIGIGNLLNVVSSPVGTPYVQDNFYQASNDGQGVYNNYIKSRGTVASPQDVQSNDLIQETDYFGVMSGNPIVAGSFGFSVDGTPNASHIPGFGYWQAYNDSGSIKSEIDLYGSTGSIAMTGNVGIGTTTPGSKLSVVGLPVYANNAAALTGGLVAGDVYRTATGVLMVTY